MSAPRLRDCERGQRQVEVRAAAGASAPRNVRAVRPAYHLNKRHWNTFMLDGTVPDLTSCATAFKESHGLAAASLTRAQRTGLAYPPGHRALNRMTDAECTALIALGAIEHTPTSTA